MRLRNFLCSYKKYIESIPRVGWDEILWPTSDNLKQKRYCYFVHSYEMKPLNTQKIIYTNDGIVAAYKKNNIWGMQFHPESIETDQGMDLIQNFMEI